MNQSNVPECHMISLMGEVFRSHVSLHFPKICDSNVVQAKVMIMVWDFFISLYFYFVLTFIFKFQTTFK